MIKNESEREKREGDKESRPNSTICMHKVLLRLPENVCILAPSCAYIFKHMRTYFILIVSVRKEMEVQREKDV